MLQKKINSQYPELQDKVVLNVDDNEMNLIVLSKILQSAGVKTIEARNGEEAIKTLNAGLKPDVILMDLEMPVMNGLDASEFIRSKIDGSIPIIINSAAISGYQKYKLTMIGIYDILEKPYNMNDIFSKLSKALMKSLA